MKQAWAGLILVGALVGCASAPPPAPFESTRVVGADFDTSWSKVIAFFAQNNVPVQTLEKDSGLIVANLSGVNARELRNFAQCRAPFLSVTVRGDVSYNVFVQPVESGTSVQVNTRFTGETAGPDGRPNGTVECQSTGVLEQRLLDAMT